MSALWITGYLATVIFGASIAIICFLRVELWLQGRRIRSRGRQRRTRLSVGAASEAASCNPEDPDVQPSGVKGPATSRAASFPPSALVAGQKPAFHGNASDEGKTATELLATSKKDAPVPNGKDTTESRLGTTSVRHSAVSASTSPSSKKGEPEKEVSSQADSGRGKKESSPAREARYAVPGATLDDLYDSEAATVISSELVDENEREQEWSVDDMIEAEVL